jgi:hypothetical protein
MWLEGLLVALVSSPDEADAVLSGSAAVDGAVAGDEARVELEDAPLPEPVVDPPEVEPPEVAPPEVEPDVAGGWVEGAFVVDGALVGLVTFGGKARGASGFSVSTTMKRQPSAVPAFGWVDLAPVCEYVQSDHVPSVFGVADQKDQ